MSHCSLRINMELERLLSSIGVSANSAVFFHLLFFPFSAFNQSFWSRKFLSDNFLWIAESLLLNDSNFHAWNSSREECRGSTVMPGKFLRLHCRNSAYETMHVIWWTAYYVCPLLVLFQDLLSIEIRFMAFDEILKFKIWSPCESFPKFFDTPT